MRPTQATLKPCPQRGWRGVENADVSLPFQGSSKLDQQGFDVLVCKDGKLGIFGVKLLLEITGTLVLSCTLIFRVHLFSIRSFQKAGFGILYIIIQVAAGNFNINVKKKTKPFFSVRRPLKWLASTRFPNFLSLCVRREQTAAFFRLFLPRFLPCTRRLSWGDFEGKDLALGLFVRMNVI